ATHQDAADRRSPPRCRPNRRCQARARTRRKARDRPRPTAAARTAAAGRPPPPRSPPPPPPSPPHCDPAPARPRRSPPPFSDPSVFNELQLLAPLRRRGQMRSIKPSSASRHQALPRDSPFAGKEDFKNPGGSRGGSMYNAQSERSKLGTLVNRRGRCQTISPDSVSVRRLAINDSTSATCTHSSRPPTRTEP